MIIGTGIDIVDVGRIENLLLKYGDRFLQRIFTPDEIVYCNGKSNPPENLAARFAAREAMVKAVGAGFTKGMRFHDVSVKMNKGRPEIMLSGLLMEIVQSAGIKKIHLSISHERKYAVALVILEV